MYLHFYKPDCQGKQTCLVELKWCPEGPFFRVECSPFYERWFMRDLKYVFVFLSGQNSVWYMNATMPWPMILWWIKLQCPALWRWSEETDCQGNQETSANPNLRSDSGWLSWKGKCHFWLVAFAFARLPSCFNHMFTCLLFMCWFTLASGPGRLSGGQKGCLSRLLMQEFAEL